MVDWWIRKKANLIDIIPHIHKPRLNESLLLRRRLIEALPKLPARLVDLPLPRLDERRRLERPIVRVRLGLVLLHLKPPARFQVLVGLPVETVPVADPAGHAAAVDEVKFLVWGPRPVALDVIDVELAVGRNPGWLDGAEVGADDFGTGELVCPGQNNRVRIDRIDQGTGTWI